MRWYGLNCRKASIDPANKLQMCYFNWIFLIFPQFAARMCKKLCPGTELYRHAHEGRLLLPVQPPRPDAVQRGSLHDQTPHNLTQYENASIEGVGERGGGAVQSS